MPRISETGTSGFTLIEVLVVVAIAGIVVALAAVNLFPSDAQVARREVASVALAVEHARDAAWFGGRPTSVTFNEGRLRLWRYSGRSWDADEMRDQPLATDMLVVGLYVDGVALAANDRVVFMPDGLGIPFSVALDARGFSWAVEGDAAGAVTAVER
jgi:general secretion pathway protein H